MIPTFRAWIPKFKEMKEVTTLEFSEGNISYVCFDYKEGGYLPSDVILMQSTGLVDKNGQEIFEGDVVRLKYTVYSDYETFKVTRFRGGSWRIDNRQRGTDLWLRHKDCEVVGNIYENKELVEA